MLNGENNPLSKDWSVWVKDAENYNFIYTDTDTGETDSNGKVKLKSDTLRKPLSGTTFTFTVDYVEKDGWTYDPSANVETSDSITY